jgi:hypothetical protein
VNLRKEPKDLDQWINKPLKVLLNADGYYKGTLLSEQKNGLLISVLGKEVYIPYESLLALEQE